MAAGCGRLDRRKRLWFNVCVWLAILILLSEVLQAAPHRKRRRARRKAPTYPPHTSAYRRGKNYRYNGTKWMVGTFGKDVEMRAGSKSFYDGKRTELSALIFDKRIYTAHSMGYYYSSFYSMYYMFGSTPSFKQRRYPAAADLCYNYERLSDNTTMGMFTCPLPFEPVTHTSCCGEVFREFCCIKLDHTGTIALRNASICIGVALCLVFTFMLLTHNARMNVVCDPYTNRPHVPECQVCPDYYCKADCASGWGQKLNFDFWRPRRLKTAAPPPPARRIPSPQPSPTPSPRTPSPRIPPHSGSTQARRERRHSQNSEVFTVLGTTEPSVPPTGSDGDARVRQGDVDGSVDLTASPLGDEEPPPPAYDTLCMPGPPDATPPSYNSLVRSGNLARPRHLQPLNHYPQPSSSGENNT